MRHNRDQRHHEKGQQHHGQDAQGESSREEAIQSKIDSQRGHNTDGTLTGTKIRRTGRSDNPGDVGHTEGQEDSGGVNPGSTPK